MKNAVSTTRWDLLLPVVAIVIGGLMVALAYLSVFAFRQRDALALDGRVFGLAHTAELLLRESDRSASQNVLEEVIADGHAVCR